MEHTGQELGPTDWAIVALLNEQPSHGWALADKFKSDGDVGAVWSLTRPVIYRSLEMLKREGLIETARLEQSKRGPYREIYRSTRRGRAGLKLWLDQPVEHMREVRSIFLLKLVLMARAGIDRKPMIRLQRQVVADFIAAHEGRSEPTTETERIYVRFRVDSSRALLRFLDDLLVDVPVEPDTSKTAAAATAARRSKTRS